MPDSTARPLPEELLLLCADPSTGKIRTPTGFHRAMAGAVLAELLLTGGLTVDDRRITAYQPLAATEPVSAAVLERLARSGKSRRPFRLDTAVRQVTLPELRGFTVSLTAQGLLRSEDRRLLGLIPYQRRFATSPETAPAITARVRAALTSFQAVERDRQLAGLTGAMGLERRLFPGAEGAELRRAVRGLSKSLPIPRAVRRVIAADSSSDG